ncbi:MAG: SNF2-related protein [Bacteroidia bacterium]
MSDNQLIFTFFRQASYGLSLEAFLVMVLENKTLSYQYQRLVFERLSDYDYPFTEAQTKVLRKISELSPKSIESQFNKKNLRSAVFLEKLATNEDQLKMLSSYFDRRLAICLDLLKGEKVYWRERPSDHPGMEELFVEENAAEVTYFFDKLDDGINYKLMVHHSGKALNLQIPGTQVLVNQPCWLLNDGKIYHFNDSTDGAKLSPFLKSEHLHIPGKLSDKFLESFMLKASRKFKVKYSGFDVSTEPENLAACFSLNSDLDGKPVIQLTYKYDRFQVTAAQEQPMLVAVQKNQPGIKLIRYSRDKNFENLMHNQALNLGLTSIRPSWFLPDYSNQNDFSQEQLLDWFTNNSAEIKAAGFEYSLLLDNQEYEPVTPVLVNVQVNENSDWFDVKAMVEIDGVHYPFIKFRKNILERNRSFKLKSGKFILLPEEWFSHYSDIFEFGENHDEELRLHKQHQGLLQDHPIISGMLSGGINQDKSSIYLQDDTSEAEIPNLLEAKLRDYQLKGFRWMNHLASKGLGACLADDMGLGKTLQVITLLLKSAETPSGDSLNNKTPVNSLELFGHALSGKTSLVVMAPSLIYNWENELRKFAPTLHVRKHLGQRRRTDTDFFENADVVLTTYGIVRNDISLLKQIQFEHIVLDESQLIKNARSVSFQAVRQLNAKQRIVLTGTPVENSLTDLWSQLTFLQPGLLGSQKYFRQEFVLPIEQNQDEGKLEKLKKIIQPFILRRTKEEVAPELPELSRRVYYCEMSDVHKKFYEEQKSIYRNKILESVNKDGMEKSQMLILRGLSHLRQIAIHPKLVDANYEGGSAKIEQVIFTLDQLNQSNKKVLLFSPFVRHLNLYRSHFNSASLPHAYLTGEIPQAQRAQVVRDFELTKGYSAFLIQLKTGGSGLNLTHADHVFLLDPWWNPAAEEQAIARSHRMGQKLPVFAWRFITKDTIEEKILKLQEKKSRIASDILEKSSALGKISKAELDELFS